MSQRHQHPGLGLCRQGFLGQGLRAFVTGAAPRDKGTGRLRPGSGQAPTPMVLLQEEQPKHSGRTLRAPPSWSTPMSVPTSLPTSQPGEMPRVHVPGPVLP